MESRSSPQRTRFRCPLCGSPTFAAVELTLKSGARVVADFYHCTECTLHFVHPERFMRVEEGAADRLPPGAVPA